MAWLSECSCIRLLLVLLPCRVASVKLERDLLTVADPWPTAQDAIEHCDADSAKIGRTAGLTISDPSHQQVVFRNGHGKKAIESMNAFPDDAHVQQSCAKLISAAGQWNQQMSKYLGSNNATETLMRAAKRLPSEHQFDILGLIAGFNDLWVPNQMRFREAGGFELAVQIAQENSQDCGVLGSFLCLVSTMFAGKGSPSRWISLGLGKQIVQAMKTCPSAAATRGEAIWDLKLLFEWSYDIFDSAEFAGLRSELVDAGLVEQVVDTLRLDASMREQNQSYDILGQDGSTLGSLRMTTSAILVLQTLGSSNATHCEIIRDSGAVEQIGEALDRYGDLRGKMPWGPTLSLVEIACPNLQKLDKTCGKGTSFASVREKLRELSKSSANATSACADFLSS